MQCQLRENAARTSEQFSGRKYADFQSFTQLSDVQRHISFQEQKRDFLSRGRGFPGMPNGLSCSTEEHVWGYGRAVMRMRGGMFRHDEKDIRGTEEPFSHDERL